MAYFDNDELYLEFWFEYIFNSLYLIQKNINFILIYYGNSKIFEFISKTLQKLGVSAPF